MIRTFALFVIPHDTLAEQLREIVLWALRGLTIAAVITLIFLVPMIWERVQDWRYYREPLGFKTPALCAVCIVATFLIWRACFI